MITTRTCILISALSLSAPLLYAQDLGQHRGIRLGSDVLTVAATYGLSAADAKTIIQRPALIQDLEWRFPRFLSASIASDEPLNDITFSFYDGQLFSIVANYDRKRTEGLTDTDLIEAMTTAYGPPLPRPSAPTARTAGTSPRSTRSWNANEGEAIARWEDAESAVTLLRTRYPSDISLVVRSKKLSGLAQSAEVESVRLDRSEAPGRETARLQKEADETRVSAEKARPANKAGFKP
jgi:hypothetical protein